MSQGRFFSQHHSESTSFRVIGAGLRPERDWMAILRIVAIVVAVLCSCAQGFSFQSPSSLQPLHLRAAKKSGNLCLHLRGGGPFQLLSKLFGSEKKPMAPKIIIAG